MDGQGNYVVRGTGAIHRASKDSKVMLAEAVMRQDGSNKPKYQRIVSMHGGEDEWALIDDPDARQNGPFPGMGLGTMNMTLWDGSTHSVTDWADIDKYPWMEGGRSGRYWPRNYNTRSSYEFWETFDDYFGQ